MIRLSSLASRCIRGPRLLTPLLTAPPYDDRRCAYCFAAAASTIAYTVESTCASPPLCLTLWLLPNLDADADADDLSVDLIEPTALFPLPSAYPIEEGCIWWSEASPALARATIAAM